MDVQIWADRLAEWFMPRGRGPQPVQLFGTTSELAALAGDGEDLFGDLRAAVRKNPPYDPTRYERRQARAWRSRRDPYEAPPGLPYILAEVLVCGEKVEAGSLAFYEPLSDALGCPSRIDAETYEQSFAPFWADLTWWLEIVNNGDRGFPSWNSIPLRGPRSVIGRPYTQILLRREDWRDVEAFLEVVGDDEAFAFEVVDRERLADALLGEFRRWATRERRVSPRLLAILGSNRQSDLDTLGYLILDRLTDERIRRGHSSGLSLPLIVTLDDWQDRTLRVGVVAPDTPRSVSVGDEVLTLDEPRCPYPTTIPLTAEMLSEGLAVQASTGELLVYRPRDAVALAGRSWDRWCSVSSVEASESVYVLCRAELRPKVEAIMDTPRAARGVAGAPPGWVLLGPSALAEPSAADDRLRGLHQRRVLVPTLTGGLRVQQGRVYLQGAPPDVVFPDDDWARQVAVDDRAVKYDACRLLRLADLDLDVGRHTITVDDVLRLDFDLVDPSWAGDHEPVAYRGSDGRFVHANETPCVAGVVANPPSERWLPLLPVSGEAVVIGDAPHTHRFRAHQAPWARACQLPFDFFDPVARMSYRSGRRPPFVPRLAAARLDGGSWDVVALPGFEDLDASHADPSWRATVAELLTHGVLRHSPARSDHEKAWRALQVRLGC